MLVENQVPDRYKTPVNNKTLISADQFTKTATGITITVHNEPKAKNIKLIKTDADDSTKFLSGATFELRDKNNITVRSGTTNTNGEINFTDIEYGTYSIIETDSPIGYALNTSPIVVYETDFETPDTIIVKQATNTKQLWNLRVVKLAMEDTSKKLPDAVFELQDANGNVIQTAKNTDTNGELVFTNIPYAVYHIVEKDSPAGYKIITTPEIVTLDKFDKNNTEVRVEIFNEKQYWDLKVMKNAKEDTNKLLSGAVFELQNIDGTVVLPAQTTNNAGEIIFKNIAYGNYQLVEKDAPTGYKILSAPIVVSESNFDKKQTEFTIIVTNEKQLWDFTVMKTGESGKPLQGAVFELRNTFGNLIGTPKHTGDNGEATFHGLEYQDYILTETQAPSGYSILGSGTLFITKERFSKSLTTLREQVINKAIPGPGGGGGGGGGGTPIVPITPFTPTTPVDPTTPITPFTPTIPSTTTPGEPMIILDTPTEDTPTIDTPALSPEENTEIIKFPKRLPKTGALGTQDLIKKVGIISAKARKTVETALPSAETFRLAGSSETSLGYWLAVVPEIDRNADKYIVLPTQGLVMPINSVAKDSQAYKNFTSGIEENFVSYLRTGAVELPGTSTRGFGEVGNKVIGGHSSYWKSAKGRYKTHFQKIIGMEAQEEIWIYVKNTSGDYTRHVYRVTASYNTKDTDISVLQPTDNATITLFTCTPIGGVAGRWIVRGELVQ